MSEHIFYVHKFLHRVGVPRIGHRFSAYLAEPRDPRKGMAIPFLPPRRALPAFDSSLPNFTYRVGVPRIELGPHPPHGCILPLYYTPTLYINQYSFTHHSTYLNYRKLPYPIEDSYRGTQIRTGTKSSQRTRATVTLYPVYNQHTQNRWLP
jgi:hypothetical protein